MPEELSPGDAARRIGATTRSVQRWIRSGKLPARRVGGRWRVATDALDAFAPGHRSATTGSEALERRAGLRTIFVANRGEIARRVERTCARLGIEAILPATEGPAAVDLLDIAAVVSAAREAGADALHPGFGFLAENADFAAAVIEAGIAWIGPPPDAIRAMGDKAAARRLAATLGVPVVPGYDGPDQHDERLAGEATLIGFPILLKPAGGGGGKGMRVVKTAADLPSAIAASRREGLAAFRDDRLVLERLVEGPRHVEIQVLFDAHGNGVHLGERDCSIQRRHQKVLEEAPSPAVTPAVRERLGEYAISLAGAVGYEGAGTCEFLLTDEGDVFFLEMNTRLQVEHPVTELVTGRDLVADQIRIAAGDDVGIAQVDVDSAFERGGHAIEVRLYAEDAEDAFLPATGTVEALRWPAGLGIRVDAGIDAGSVVTARFDPMLAKIVAHGADRDEALDRLADALDRTVVLGLTTNLRFLRWLVRRPEVRDGEARIDTLERIWPPDDIANLTAIPDGAWAQAARVLVGAEAANASAWGGGWRVNAAPRVRLAADGFERTVHLDDETERAESASVLVGDTVHLDIGGRSVAFRPAPPPDVDRAARAAAAAHHGAGAVELTAPMPGSIVAVHAEAGAAVETGDPIVALEAMKMEHVVVAPVAGTVSELRVRPGQQVARGELLAVVEP